MIVSLLILTSFASALLVARLFSRKPVALTEHQRMRMELDALLDQLDPSELKGVARVSRKLADRHGVERTMS